MSETPTHAEREAMARVAMVCWMHRLGVDGTVPSTEVLLEIVRAAQTGAKITRRERPPLTLEGAGDE